MEGGLSAGRLSSAISARNYPFLLRASAPLREVRLFLGIVISLIFASTTFAAALLIDKCDDCAFTCVGPQELAKDFGTVTLYRLDQMCGLTPV